MDGQTTALWFKSSLKTVLSMLTYFVCQNASEQEKSHD